MNFLYVKAFESYRNKDNDRRDGRLSMLFGSRHSTTSYSHFLLVTTAERGRIQANMVTVYRKQKQNVVPRAGNIVTYIQTYIFAY